MDEAKLLNRGIRRQKLIEGLEREKNRIGGYEEWYNSLEEFRRQLGFLLKKTDNDRYDWKYTWLESGDLIDHHVLGYYAPLDFKRIGFNAEKRTPSEQIEALVGQLKQKGDIRFIYVTLPCKLAVYPELAVDTSCIPKEVNGKVIPQWRKMISECLDKNIEVLDCYDLFLQNKDKKLFQRDHRISPMGAKILADYVCEYLEATTESDILNKYQIDLKVKREKICSELLGKLYTYEASVVQESADGLWQPYTGETSDWSEASEIGIIGNCNLQAYRETGAGIVANLSASLNYPISYIGRYLPFCALDRIGNIKSGMLKNTKILLYFGFPSASYVRAYHSMADLWSLDLIKDDAFL